MTPAPAVVSPAIDLDTARAHATAYGEADAPLGRSAGPLRLPDHPGLSTEDTGELDFPALLGAHFHPAGPRDRIEHSWMSPAALDAAAAALIAGLAVSRGRHNRYRPVPQEDALRTDDIVDFLRWYGHEYQIVVFRAADVRTASVLDLEELTAVATAEGASVMWDWTGAVDWLPALPATDGATAVFWSAHSSLIDGRRFEAGVWRPGEGPFPEALAPRPLPASVRSRTERLTEFAGRVLAGALAGSDARVLHSADTATSLPLVVLESPGVAGAVADALAAGPGFAGVVRYGDRVVALADAAAGYTEIVDRVAAASHAVRS